MDIKEIATQLEIERAFPIMKELRSELSFQDYVAIYEQAKAADSYTLVGAYEGGNCVALMGYRVLHDYVHGKHVYIDDLVTTESCRSKGVGSKLLSFAEAEAGRLGCSGLRLCTGIANEGGKKFYEREGWQFRSIVYKKKLKT